MRNILLILPFALIVSCASKSAKIDNNHTTLGTAWFQNAGEVKALQYQAFNVAKLQLEKMAKRYSKIKRAVVLDIDETILDNSPYQAKSALENISYPTQWREWIDSGSAEAIPGAKEFLDYANSKGFEIFYISNRKEIGLEPTIKNLKAVGFPFKESNIFLRTTTNSKEERRKKVEENYRIVMLIGDALGDFGEHFEGLNTMKRNAVTDQEKAKFGVEYIVLPNPMYGEWEGAIYDYKYPKTSEEKHLKLKSNLKSF